MRQGWILAAAGEAPVKCAVFQGRVTPSALAARRSAPDRRSPPPGRRIRTGEEGPRNLDSNVQILILRRMQLTAQEEYGLRCLLELSRHCGSEPATIQEIARAEGISPDYAAKLLRELRRGGLVSSSRGAAGGYRLTRQPEEISVWDAIEVLGGSLFPDRFCEFHPGQHPLCVRGSDCSIRTIWRLADDAVRSVLGRISLRDLHRAEVAMGTWLETRP
jgi:Rrf2 family protein